MKNFELSVLILNKYKYNPLISWKSKIIFLFLLDGKWTFLKIGSRNSVIKWKNRLSSTKRFFWETKQFWIFFFCNVFYIRVLFDSLFFFFFFVFFFPLSMSFYTKQKENFFLWIFHYSLFVSFICIDWKICLFSIKMLFSTENC